MEHEAPPPPKAQEAEVEKDEGEKDKGKRPIQDEEGQADEPSNPEKKQKTEEDQDQEEEEAGGESDKKGPVRGEEGFTSEIYKLRVENVPKYTTAPDIKKFFSKNGIETVKVKRNPHWDYMFVTFEDDESKSKALQKINEGLVMKGRQLKAMDAPALEDPVKKERQRANQPSNKPQPNLDPSKPTFERLNDQVTPLWRKPYKAQLEEKRKSVRHVLRDAKYTLNSYIKEAKKNNPDLDYSWAKGELLCPLEEITPSPVEKDYRNKCEFSIGIGEDGLPTVGFMLGLYKDGIVSVVDPSKCIHLSQLSITITQAFQEYVRQSSYPVYDKVQKKGFWKLLVIRTTQANRSMIIVQINPTGVPDSEIEEEKKRLKDFFESKKEICSYDSVLFQRDPRASVGFQEGSPCEHLAGKNTIEETLLGKRFQISPTSFFQTNTLAAEVLYSIVGDLCSENKDTILLDLCCGTGTIGLTLANRVKKVIGVEMVKEAIEDAKLNAQLNGIENVEYHCNKVEEVIDEIIKNAGDAPIVAVLDPPRNGLPSSVMKTVRTCESLKRLVYVSCDPKLASTNFVDLCRPGSKKNPGEPFKPVKAIPVDMFPHTAHCELVIEFERS